MKQNVIAPSPGESITEVSIVKWFKQNGEAVKNGEVLLEIESDKATVQVVAESNGVLTILKQADETIPVGEVMGFIDDEATATASAAPVAQAAAPVAAAAPTSPPPSAAPAANGSPAAHTSGPAVAKIASERGVDLSQVPATGRDGRVTKGDILNFNPHAAGAAPQASPAPAASSPAPSPSPAVNTPAPSTGTGATVAKDRPGQRRVKMTRMRQKIAQTLKGAQENAAILTTFNEVDMSYVMTARNPIKDAFKAKHGVPLSYMSFFTRACVMALKELPDVNAFIEGTDIIYNDYQDVGIAVGTERGLVVPVIRDAGNKGFVELEKAMADLATKARDGKLSISDMTGGTFTISNGGVYGSMMSTPILNPPQSGILGMHNIIQRPVAVDGKVEIRPMMYLALSYDHRIIDGKGAVTFLVKLRDFLQNPESLDLSFAKEL